MKSVWQENNRHFEFPELSGTVYTDILVIGGGMAGILCAWKLQQAGMDAIVLEAEQVGSGITARTTAVLTAQHDFLYQDMMQSFGVSTAKAYLDANLEAVKAFRELSGEFPCDFEDRDSIQYTVADPCLLRREARIVKDLGFPAEFIKEIPLPIKAAGAVVYPDMAQFHPLKFLTGMAKQLRIYENSRVLQMKGTTAKLQKGSIHAKRVIVATHFPFIDRYGLYFMKLYQNRSYVLALENAPDPGATLAELEGKGIYFRSYRDLLLVGGGDHRTGKKGGGFQSMSLR